MTSQPLKLDKATLIPLAMVGSIVLATIYGTRWVTTAEARMDQQSTVLRELANAVANNTTLLREATADRWTKADMHNWVEQLSDSNEAIRVPLVR